MVCAVGGKKPPLGRPEKFENACSFLQVRIWERHCLIEPGGARSSAVTASIPATAPRRLPPAIHTACQHLSPPSTDPLAALSLRGNEHSRRAGAAAQYLGGRTDGLCGADQPAERETSRGTTVVAGDRCFQPRSMCSPYIWAFTRQLCANILPKSGDTPHSGRHLLCESHKIRPGSPRTPL
ncbi:hypothetical protein DAEQUDRAFT_14689 [Daedalea quercina L-15889]|uniref:Uncharacterized protein n=1 Tax=Daedalea quercina L-15889 TaxID=1314783 RepID=A0A165UIB4_9APHY|nr:hypothetical protein DAEQUDRAFT_14689 [Daedalea quercina L-15889]